MKRAARFEVVRTDADQPFIARFIASNGSEIWRASENYARRKGALNAISVLASTFGAYLYEPVSGVSVATQTAAGDVEVREIDERSVS